MKDCKSTSEAALALNASLFKNVGVRYHPTKRPKPDQSPSESIGAGYASCSGLSILLVDACRAVGVRRESSEAGWTVARPDVNGNHGGNHTWVEIWDGQWHVLGLQRYRRWIRPGSWERVARARRRHSERWTRSPHLCGLLAKTATPFRLIWDDSIQYVPADDVTATYADRTPVTIRIPRPEDPASATHLRLTQGKRLVADLEMKEEVRLVLSVGQSYDAEVLTGAKGEKVAKIFTVPAEATPVVLLK